MNRLTTLVRGGVVASSALLLATCVTKHIPVTSGPGSMRVSIVSIDPPPAQPGCTGVSELGSEACPHPFPEAGSALSLTVRAELLDRNGQPLAAESPITALVDVRPGEVMGVGPAGTTIRFAAGESVSEDLPIQIIHAFGATRIWVEDCGSSVQPGSFATGVSDTIWFDLPTISQVNATDDNSTSPMVPKPTNVCAIAGDPRFGVGSDQYSDTTVWVGYSHGGAVNAPPPGVGTFIDMVGCSRAEYDQLKGQGGCARGPIVVTALTNDGFYVTDFNPAAMARGFNHIYSFNYNYPENLEVGDLLLTLRGSPVEFAGATQLSNPTWTRDGVRLGQAVLDDFAATAEFPHTIEADFYASAITTYGRNVSSNQDLEKLEGALVCMDNLAAPSVLETCDKNDSGGIERQGCMISNAGDLPPVCPEMGAAPVPPLCDVNDPQDVCLPLTTQQVQQCALGTYVPANPAEYCCERICYNDPACTESSSYLTYGQWAAEVHGWYEVPVADPPLVPVKVALATRDGDPDFDPLAFGAEQLAKPADQRDHLKIVGNLRQVLAARPVWIIVARSPADIVVNGTCPRP